MSLTIYPVGGLGNQLFIYAAGLAHSRRIGTDLVIDPIHLILDPQRTLELTTFESDFSLVDRDEPNLLLHLKQKLLLLRNGPIESETTKHGLSPVFNYSPITQFSKGNGKLWGYFQSWKYFESVSDELRPSMRRIKNKSKWFDEVSEEIQSRESAIAVHVRRGDFVGNTKIGPTPEAYFRSALTLLNQKLDIEDIFVFSDEIDSLEENSFLSTRARKIHYVSNSVDSKPIEILNLMAACDHVVMANSSLSWWGAWLGSRPTQIVVYPRPWSREIWFDDRDFALPAWISMGFSE